MNYVLRPVREDMGLVQGTKNLPWLMQATVLSMVAVNPLFSMLVSKFERRRFIPIFYRFLALNLLIFFALLLLQPHGKDATPNFVLARVFYVWVSVINLLAVSVFWGLMADVFNQEQGKRLFGFIAFGGTVGAIAGSAFVTSFADRLSHPIFLLISAALLELAVQAMRGLLRTVSRQEIRGKAAAPDERIRGGAFAGMKDVVRSSYLRWICAFALLMAITNTFLYLVRADVVDTATSESVKRLQIFANIDLSTNVLAMIIQFLFTGHIVRAIGVGPTMAVLPLINLAGFGALGLFPSLMVVSSFNILQRGGEFALSKPARETLYTVVDREKKYKAKSFIDTAVYRVGDYLGSNLYLLLGVVSTGVLQASKGLTIVDLSQFKTIVHASTLIIVTIAAVILSLVWIPVCLLLGRRQRQLAGAS
jgi:AAA family ATP:ADP antiporter